MRTTRLRSLLAALIAALLSALSTTAFAADGKLTAVDALSLALPPPGTDGKAWSFLVFSPDEDVDRVEVAVEEIKGPESKPIPSPDWIDAKAQKRPLDGERSFLATLTPKAGAFAAPGDYAITLRITGFAAKAEGPKPDGGAARDGGAERDGKERRLATLVKTATIHRPVAEIADQSGVAVRILRSLWSPASEKVRYDLRPKVGELATCTVSGARVLEKAAEGSQGREGHGSVKPVAGSCGVVEVLLGDFDTPGVYTSALLVESAALGPGVRRIPIQIEVTDGLPGPLMVILLGVLAAFFVNVLARGLLASDQKKVRVFELRSELARCHAGTDDPVAILKLDELSERLAHIETSSKLQSALDDVARELETIRTNLLQKRTALVERLTALRNRLFGVDLSSLDDVAKGRRQSVLDKLESAAPLIGSGKTSAAERQLSSAEAEWLSTPTPAAAQRAGRPRAEAGLDAGEPSKPAIILRDSSRRALSSLSFAIEAADPEQAAGGRLEWEFGDGTPAVQTDGREAQHEFARAGS